jgi:hypothetical protein
MSTFYKVLVWITSVTSLLCLSLVIWAVLQVFKYLPSLYLNLACYLARKADTEPATEAPKGRTEAVNVLTEGMKFLQKQKNAEGVKALREMIVREKDRRDAFKNLSKENVAALDALVASAA